MMRKSNIKYINKSLKLLVSIICILISVAFKLISYVFQLVRYVVKVIELNIESSKQGFNYAEKLKHLSPRQFEKFCCELFKQLGYKAELTSETNDYGRDIILKKDGMTIFVECKYYSEENTIGREICQKLLGSMYMFNADAGIIITTGTFHRNAIEVADMVDNLKLFNTKDILGMIKMVDKPQKLFLSVV